MLTKKLALVAATVVLVGAMAFAPGSSSGAQDGQSDVAVIHGIGPGPAPVDVYIATGATATEWDLLIPGLEYEELFDVGNVPVGEYNILLCNAVANPADQVTSCPEGAVNGNFGTDIQLVEGPVAVIAAYGGPDTAAPGRPTVIAPPVNFDCVETATTARATGIHAAAAPPVNVLADGADVFTDLAFGEAADVDVPAGAYDLAVELLDGTPVLTVPDAELAAQVNTLAIVVGNPQQEAPYEALVYTNPLDVCPPPSTTTTTTATTTATAAPVRPATVRPAFTG